MVPLLNITPHCQPDLLNEEVLIHFVSQEWKSVSFSLCLARVTSSITLEAGYIDLDMKDMDPIEKAEILEDGKDKEGY